MCILPGVDLVKRWPGRFSPRPGSVIISIRILFVWNWMQKKIRSIPFFSILRRQLFLLFFGWTAKVKFGICMSVMPNLRSFWSWLLLPHNRTWISSWTKDVDAGKAENVLLTWSVIMCWGYWVKWNPIGLNRWCGYIWKVYRPNYWKQKKITVF